MPVTTPGRLHRMGDGVVHWSNIKEVQKIRKRYAQTTSANSVPDKSKSLKMVPCIQFNKGTCNRNGEHEYKNMLLKHMCQFCFSQSNKIESHAKKDCWRASKDASKTSKCCQTRQSVFTRFLSFKY